MLVKRGLLCRPEGLLYQVKGLLCWPGASCVLKWASYIGQRPSYINHGASRNRGPPAYTRRHVPCVSQGLLTSARASLYLPGPPEWVKTCFLHWPEELLYQAKGLLYLPGASCVDQRAYIRQKTSYIGQGASYMGEMVLYIG